MNILAIAGSLRQGSYNRQLAAAAATVMHTRHPDVAFESLAWDDVPVLNQDIEFPAPDSVTRVRASVKQADGLWLFSPEYNHAIPGPFKNLIDWLSRPVSATEGPVLAGKPVALSGASIGMGGTAHAQDELVMVLGFIDARVMNQPRLAIPHIATQADQGILKLTTSQPYLEKQADAFVRFVEHETHTR